MAETRIACGVPLLRAACGVRTAVIAWTWKSNYVDLEGQIRSRLQKPLELSTSPGQPVPPRAACGARVSSPGSQWRPQALAFCGARPSLRARDSLTGSLRAASSKKSAYIPSRPSPRPVLPISPFSPDDPPSLADSGARACRLPSLLVAAAVRFGIPRPPTVSYLQQCISEVAAFFGGGRISERLLKFLASACAGRSA